MMEKYALILDTQVLDTSYKPFEVALPLQWVACPDAIEAHKYTYDNGVFEELIEPEPEPEPIVIPSEITPRQARLQLAILGKLSLVEPTIASLPEPDKTYASIEWEYATVYKISNPFIQQLAPSLEIDLEELFMEASKL